MRGLLLIAGMVMAATPAGAETNPFAAASRVPDAELATMRGGFALPNGFDISLAVQMDAAIDGALVLRTVFVANQGAPTLAVYAPPAGTTGPAWSTPPVAAASATTPPVLLLDRAAGTTTLQPGTSLPTSIAVSTGTTSIGTPLGYTPLDATVGGPGVATAAGTVRLAQFPPVLASFSVEPWATSLSWWEQRSSTPCRTRGIIA